MVYTGHPQFVATASDNKTLTEIIAYAHADNVPITFCGSQTSMTGASAADSGIVVPLAARAKILDIGRDTETGAGFVITEPGVILGDLKRAVAAAGYFYPPDPTSYNEAQIGATVATNATGEDTYKYGPTRSYVSELEIIDSGGKLRTLKRERPLAQTSVKNAAGYFLGGEEIDEVIGSEGTLAVITKLKLRLLDGKGKNVFLFILPFSNFENALKAVLNISGNSSCRALELIGPGAAAYFKSCQNCPEELKTEDVFLYIKDEYENETDLNAKIESWFANLQALYTELGDAALLERIFIAQTAKQLEDIHACRHHIPLKVNEDFFPLMQNGGGKVGTDWWVPLRHLQDMMLWTFTESKKLAADFKIPFLVFAHIGNGHPHWNYLTKNPEEKNRAQDFVKRQCKRAVLYGGGVAGEHGIGKIKRDLLAIQHKPDVIAQMRALKLKWDPNWIFGRGNILNQE